MEHIVHYAYLKAMRRTCAAHDSGISFYSLFFLSIRCSQVNFLSSNCRWEIILSIRVDFGDLEEQISRNARVSPQK
jgi:hypothetical protein